MVDRIPGDMHDLIESIRGIRSAARAMIESDNDVFHPDSMPNQ